MTTANTTFSALSTLIAANFQPPGRATATAATFNQLAEIGGDLPLTMADAAKGFALLSTPKPSDADITDERAAGALKARRVTCREVAILAGDFDDNADPRRLADVLATIGQRFAGSTDPRQVSMAGTATREAGELRTYT